jgi:dienelactone hydrolase
MQKKLSVAKKQILAFGCFSLIFISSNLLFYLLPTSIQRHYNLSTVTADGVSLKYDLYEPIDIEGSVKKPGIILAHGLMVNKDMMRFMAIELARDGFIVIAHDFRSHGASGGNFNMMAQGIVDSLLHDAPSSNTTGTFPASYNRSFLKADVDAIKAVLVAHPHVDPQNLGYLGFSMGAEAGFEILPYDPDFQATVGMGPTFNYDLVNNTSPRNLLLLVGRFDEAIRIDKLYTVMSYRTNLNTAQIESGKIYGTFSDGSASKLYIDPFAEHFLAPYNYHFIREARAWFGQALMGRNTTESSPVFPVMVFLVIFQIIGAFGMFIISSKILIQKYTHTRTSIEETIPSVGKGFIPGLCLFLLVSSYPLMLTFIPVFAAPLLFSGMILFLMGGPTLGIWLFIKLYYRRQENTKVHYLKLLKQSTSAWNILIGLINGAFLIFVLRFSLGNIFGIIPHPGKWGWFGFYGIVLTGLFIPLYWLFEIISSKVRSLKAQTGLFTLKMGIQTFFILSLIIITLIIVPCMIFNNYFVAMILIPIELLVALIAFIGAFIYHQNKDIFLAIIPNAMFGAVFLAVLSPIFELWHLTY